VLRLRGGCPPKRCTCCELYQGVKIWSYVFMVLAVINLVVSVYNLAVVASYCGSQFGAAVCGVAIVLNLATVIFMVILVYVFYSVIKGLGGYSEPELRKQYKNLVRLTIVSAVVGIVAAILVGQYYYLVNVVVQVAFAAWYFLGVKAVADEIEAGRLGPNAASNPGFEGAVPAGGYNGAQYAQPNYATAQPATATPVVTGQPVANAQPAQAVAVAQPAQKK